MEALNRHLFILKISFSYLRPYSVAFFFDAKDFPSFDIKEFLDQHSGIINLNRPYRVDRCQAFLVFPSLVHRFIRSSIDKEHPNAVKTSSTTLRLGS